MTAAYPHALPATPSKSESDPLDDRAGAQPAAAAHRHESGLGIGSLELVQQGRDEPRAGGAERVAEAIAPPLTLTVSMSGSSSRRQAATTARRPH
jgi:hypothetical protein